MILLQGNGIARTFGGDTLFENINFSLQDHSRIALVGAKMELVSQLYLKSSLELKKRVVELYPRPKI
jgi:hypothetical protein